MRFFVLSVYVLMSLGVWASAGDVRWHNEANDTVRITKILADAASKSFANPSERTGYIARQFLGTPYVANTLEGKPEQLTINLDELDCTTLVDVVMAMSYTLGERRTAWQDFVYNLRRLRYRGGEVDGYASRLHYNCDWAVDNTHRGNITDITPRLPKCSYIVRSINYMTTHRDSYAALADSATHAAIAKTENGYRNHRFPYIKAQHIRAKEIDAALRDGDIIAFVTKMKGMDVTHMGIVVKVNGETHALHASMTNGKVEITESSLADFVRRNSNWIGIRVYRLRE